MKDKYQLIADLLKHESITVEEAAILLTPTYVYQYYPQYPMYHYPVVVPSFWPSTITVSAGSAHTSIQTQDNG